MEINDSIVNELFLNPELRKSDTRTVIFLLSNPGALSSDELAKGIGISGKSANKSIKRLINAGVILVGEPQAKKRTFVVQLSEPKEPREVTEGNNDTAFNALMERFNRLEEILGALMDTKGACFNPAPAPDGQEVTGKVPVCSQDDEQKNIHAEMIPESGQKGTIEEPSFLLQDKKYLENIPIGTIGTEQGTKEPQNDSIVADLDTAIIRARTAAFKAASLLKEKQKQKQPGARTSIDDEFHTLFGVKLPVGSDPAAVGVMIARKKAGKLDVKSPLAYLASLAGKVAPILTTSGTLNPESQVLVQPTIGISASVNARLSHEDISRINDMWENMTGEQRMPYQDKALPKFEQQSGRYKVPLNLLAKSIFNNEQMMNHHKGVTI